MRLRFLLIVPSSPCSESASNLLAPEVLRSRKFRLWHIDTAQQLAVLALPDGFERTRLRKWRETLVFSPDGELASQTDLGICQFSLRTKRAPDFIACLPFGVEYSPDGRTLLIRYEDAIGLLDVATLRTWQQIEVGGWGVACACSPDCKLLAVCARDMEPIGRKLAWRVHAGLADRLFPQESHTILFDTITGRCLALLPFSSHVAFRPDGQTLVTYDENSDVAMLWDVPPRPRFPFVLRLATFLLPLGLTFSLRRRKKSNPEATKSEESSAMS